MTKNIGIQILVTIVLLVCGACSRTPMPTGSVTMTFNIGDIGTKAGDGVVADGGGIYIVDNTTTPPTPDLNIFIINSSGSVVARYPGSSASLSSVSVHETTSKVTTATVKFTSVEEGEYEVYAVANSGSTLSTGTDWSTISTKAALDALTFPVLSDLTPPSVGDRMPLSAKGALSVNSSGNGQVDLNMLRSVAKTTVIFKNLTDTDLSLSDCDITIKGINPTTGYLFKPEGDDAAGSSRNLALTSGSSVTIPQNGSETISPVFVFPSIAPANPGYYTCDISFTINSTPKSYSSLPIHDNKSQNILFIERNQYLQIEIRISNQTNVSFNFEVSDWTTKPESVTFH